MSTVVFNKRLIDQILHNVSALYDAKVSAATKVPEHWADMVLKALYNDETVARMNALPPEYFNTVDGIWVRGASRVAYIRFRGRLVMPYTLNRELNGAIGGSYGVGNLDIIPTDQRWHTFIEENKLWDEGIKCAEKEQRDAKDGANRLIKAYRTLAPALKAWPALWMLLPDWAQNKHKEVVVKTRASATAPDVDLSNVTAQIVVNRLTGKSSNGQ